ncbi:MAG: hypothetical protein ACKODX_14365 [Gemmata sp.]|jgi:hypothetical protein
MRKLMLISVLGTLAGYAGVHFAFFSPPAAVPAPAAPAEPVVLAAVVEVTDTEPLLDPPPGHPVGVPFDPPVPAELAAPAPAAPIPRAAD